MGSSSLPHLAMQCWACPRQARGRQRKPAAAAGRLTAGSRKTQWPRPAAAPRCKPLMPGSSIQHTPGLPGSTRRRGRTFRGPTQLQQRQAMSASRWHSPRIKMVCSSRALACRTSRRLRPVLRSAARTAAQAHWYGVVTRCAPSSAVAGFAVAASWSGAVLSGGAFQETEMTTAETGCTCCAGQDTALCSCS